MSNLRRSPWIAVVLVIAGMTLGYSFELLRTGTATAAATECPFTKACEDAGCSKEDCQKGTCKHDCPGCKGMPQS